MKTPSKGKRKVIIEHKEYLEVYEFLRRAHSEVKNIWHLDKQPNKKMLVAVDKVHDVLYAAEKLACKLAYPHAKD